jgi:RNA polymerase sigma factor (sigma-70 family)
MEDELGHIITGCKAGDHKSYEALYKRFYRLLLGVACRYTRSTEEAEDILQDAFIKVFHNIGSFSGKGSFEGWIRRIVQNTAINYYRSRLKFEKMSEGAETESDGESDESIIGGMDAKTIIALLNRMPEGYRLLINLYAIDGYTHAEIGEMLGISTGTSKSQLFKAKKYLRELLKNDFNAYVL